VHQSGHRIPTGVSTIGAGSWAAGLTKLIKVESTRPPETSDVAQSSLLINQAAQRGLDGCLDRVGAGRDPGVSEELIIDFNESLRHDGEDIRSSL